MLINLNRGVKWESFCLDDIVTIDNGKRLTKAEMIGGTTPFIGASESNNGLTAFTSIINKSLDKNVLGVNYNGSVGFAFYHPYKALFSDDVKRVRWKANKHNNRHTLLFLSTAIACQRRKFAYGYKFNTQRMRRQKILLPVESDGSLHWQYIQESMEKAETDSILAYLRTIKRNQIDNKVLV